MEELKRAIKSLNEIIKEGDLSEARIIAEKLITMPFLLKNFMADEEIDYLESNFERFLLEPSLDEAKTYGQYKDAEDQNESYYVKLAQPYTLFEQLKMIFKKDYKHHHNEWKEGALQLTKGDK